MSLSRIFMRSCNFMPFKNETLLSLSRLAKKRADPAFEKFHKNNNNKNKEQDVNFKKETLFEKIKLYFIRDIIPISLVLGVTGYIFYSLYKKKEESKNLDQMHVKNSFLKIRKIKFTWIKHNYILLISVIILTFQVLLI